MAPRPLASGVGRCGADFGGASCAVGRCCSQDGYCGTTVKHCFEFYGCQSGCARNISTTYTSTTSQQQSKRSSASNYDPLNLFTSHLDQDDPPPKELKLPPEKIAVGVLFSVIALILLCWIFVCICKRRRVQRAYNPDPRSGTLRGGSHPPVTERTPIIPKFHRPPVHRLPQPPLPRICSSCKQVSHWSSFPPAAPTRLCDHPSSDCYSCLHRHYRSQPPDRLSCRICRSRLCRNEVSFVALAPLISHYNTYYTVDPITLDNTRDCDICLSPYSDIQPRPVTSHCTHHRTSCRDCIALYIATAIHSTPPNLAIQCPQPECSSFLTADDIIFFASGDDRQLWEELRAKETRASDPTHIFCPKCGLGSYHLKPGSFFGSYRVGAPAQGRVLCPGKECGFEMCMTHNMPWHDGKTCQQVDEEDDERFIEDEVGAKKCTGCGIWTVKTEGCRHMTCVKCRAEWCWGCGVGYERKGAGRNGMGTLTIQHRAGCE